MRADPKSRSSPATNILAGIIIVMVIARVIPAFYEQPNFSFVLIIVVSFLLLFALEILFSEKLRKISHFYFLVQTALVTTLSLLHPFQDVTSALYLALIAQSIQVLQEKPAYAWWGILAAMTAVTLIIGSGWIDGIPLALYFLVAGFYVVSFDMVFRQAKKGQEESAQLLADLEKANRDLKEQASQAEELAATRERNRLARELHDSVSQVIFSITLNAQSARMLLERDPSKVSYLLDRLQALTSGALEQLRSLISQLHPPSKSK